MLPDLKAFIQYTRTMEDLKNNNTGSHENTSSGEAGSLNESANMTGQTELPEELADETEKIRAELAEQKEKYLRLYAEFDNYKRRSARERVELMQTAGREVIVSLLEVLDDCDRAEKQFAEGGQKDAMQEGVILVFNKLRSVLFAKGVKPMDCKGAAFNPDEHEAVSQVPVADEDLKGKVIEEIVKGYYLNDKIIRFAKVVVGL